MCPTRTTCDLPAPYPSGATMKTERLPDDYAKSVLSGVMEAAQSMQDERSPGLHVSKIIRSIMETLEPRRFKGDKPPPIEWISAGVVWEYLLEAAMAKLATTGTPALIRPGEVEKDGIICTLDAVSVGDWVVHEFKFTWMSSRDAVGHKKFYHWLLQLKAYCYALGTNHARLHAFFVMGDYKGSGPQPLAWDLQFTDLELRETWEMLVNHAKDKGWL